MAKKLSPVRKAVLFQFLGIGVTAVMVWILSTFFPLLHWISALQHWMAELGPLGAALYPVVYAICNVLLLPAGVLAIGSGFFFGLWWGSFLVLFGNVLGAAIAFGISRSLARKWIESRLRHHPKLAALDGAIAAEGWKIVVMSQVHPLFPTSLINYLYGITRLRFAPCMLWVAIGQAPGLFLYAYLGTLGQFGINTIQGVAHPTVQDWSFWIAGLVLTLCVALYLFNLAFRVLRKIEAVESSNCGQSDEEESGIQETEVDSIPARSHVQS